MSYSRSSRRRFLRTSAATAVAAAAGVTIVPRSAIGADPAKPAPSNRINMAFIGVGGQGRYDMGNFLGHKEVQGLAVCDCDASERDKAKEQVEKKYAEQTKAGTYKGCAGYNDFREVLERKDVDAVMIATPDHWHAGISIAAAAAGKDIYCEKPLSLTIGEARAMVDAVRRYDRVFQTGSQQRSHGPFRHACELIRSGFIGKVHTVYVRVWGPARECDLPGEPVPAGLDWDLWLGPAPWRPFHNGIIRGGFRPFRDYSGGGVTDWGAHHFDIIQWALDMDASGPVAFYPSDGKDNPCLRYEYAGGPTVWHLDGPGEKEMIRRMPVPATGGNVIFFHGDKGWIEVSRDHIRSDPAPLAKRHVMPADVHLYRSPGHTQDFVNCVQARRRPICDVEVGARTVTVCHLVNITYWLNRPIRWDPAAERVVDDAEAQRWTDRPKRAPWHVHA
jgi:predicted dehydrogenase